MEGFQHRSILLGHLHIFGDFDRELAGFRTLLVDRRVAIGVKTPCARQSRGVGDYDPLGPNAR
jgi:hypothetical protein